MLRVGSRCHAFHAFHASHAKRCEASMIERTRSETAADLESRFLRNGHRAQQWARLVDLELHQDRRGGRVRSEKTTGDRRFTPLIEEISEPDGAGLSDVQAVKVKHVLAVDPHIEVVERLGRGIDDDQTAAIAEDLNLHHGPLAELLGIRPGRSSRVVFFSATASGCDHREGEDRGHGGSNQATEGRELVHGDCSRGSIHEWMHGSGDLGSGVISRIEEITARGATIRL